MRRPEVGSGKAMKIQNLFRRRRVISTLKNISFLELESAFDAGGIIRQTVNAMKQECISLGGDVSSGVMYARATWDETLLLRFECLERR